MADILALTKKDSLARRLQRIELQMQRHIASVLVWFRKVDDKLIIFESFYGATYACSPKAIYEYMLSKESFAEYRFVWAFKDCSRHADIAENPRTTLVAYDSRQYRQTYASAKYWVVNAMLPLTIAKHPTKQVMVQCFHGTPLKRLRNDIIDDSQATIDSAADHTLRNTLDTQRYDFFVSPSRYASERFTSAFGLQELGKQDILIETGYPRNDFLHTHTPHDVQRIKRRLGIPVSKKVLLYAPTWRDDQYDPVIGYTFDPRLDFAALRQQLGDEYVLLFRLHYNVAETFNFKGSEGFIYDVSQVDDINELYIISDVLMTDYSSVFFDFANLQRPILFYMYDQEHYQKQLRGFYLESSALPGDVVSTQLELVDRLSSIYEYSARHTQVLRTFSETYNYLDDGKAAARVVDIITSV